MIKLLYERLNTSHIIFDTQHPIDLIWDRERVKLMVPRHVLGGVVQLCKHEGSQRKHIFIYHDHMLPACITALCSGRLVLVGIPSLLQQMIKVELVTWTFTIKYF